MKPKIQIIILIVGAIVSVRSYDFRLPDNVIPEHYKIKILTDLDNDFSYNGKVFIDFVAKSETDKIVLHSKNLKIFEEETTLEECENEHKTSNSEKVMRRPKRSFGDDVEIRGKSEDVISFVGNERIVADEDEKPDVIFDRREEMLEESEVENSPESFSNREGVEQKTQGDRIVTEDSKHTKITNPKPSTSHEGYVTGKHPTTDHSAQKQPPKVENTASSITNKKPHEVPPPSTTAGYTKHQQTTKLPTTMDDRIHFETGSYSTTTDKLGNTRVETKKPLPPLPTVPTHRPEYETEVTHPVKATTNHPVRETTHYPHPVKETTHYPHPAKETTHYPHPVKETTDYPHPDKVTTHYPHPSKKTTHYPHPAKETTHYPHPVKETTDHPHPVKETTHYPHSAKETTHYPYPAKETTHYPHPAKETTHYPHPAKGTTLYPHTVKETTNYPHPVRETTQYPNPSKETTHYPHPARETTHYPHPAKETTHYPHPDKVTTHSPRPVKGATDHPYLEEETTNYTHPTKETTSDLHHIKEPITSSHSENYKVVKHDYDLENNFLVIHVDRPLTSGKKYRLFFNYQGVLTDTLTGFHRVPYVKRGSQKSTWLASTVFQPNEARTAFPCFDEPALKATFDVTLGHHKKFTALSNMPLKSKTPVEGQADWQWSEFETTPKMSTYLVAFLISDLEYLTPRVNYTEGGSNVTYRFWSRHDVLYKTRYAMRIAPEMKNYLENLFEVKDVMPKHDFVALPSFISNALENWGLYSFAEKNLLFTPGFSSIFSKYEITHVLGHEISHMWFGNLVTPKWWDQIWLSEGFSNFFEIIAADHVQPTWDLKTISVIFSYLKVFTLDAMHTSHPLVPRISDPNDLNDIFDSISYQKGFYLVRMLNYTLGQEAFMNGVRRYLKNNILSNVDENDLWEVLTECAHQENTLPADYHLKDIMHAWTRKTGYPIIEVIRDYDQNTANITQRRFLRSKDDFELRTGSSDIESQDTKWWIPLTYTTGSELNFRDTQPRVWFSPEEEVKILTDMPSRNDFVLMNLDAAGLYRVNYDERNWDLIISYLINENSSDVSIINRVQILDDLLDFARAGEISYETALDATSYLTKERHFLPWKAALSNFDFISRMLRSTNSNKSFKKFVRNLVANRFEELGFESTRNEPLSDGLNRKQIVKWACKTGLRQCTRKSIALFKKWSEEKKPDEYNPIPSNLRSIVYCAAIENGGSKDWQFLWQRYLSNVVTDKTAILYGLGCSKNTRTLRKYLDWSIKETSGIKKQDTPTVFKAVVRNDVGFSLAKNFLKERMGDIRTYLGNNPFYLPQMIEAVAAKMNQPSDLDELEELEQTHFSHLRSVPRSFRQATERVRFNINWVEKNYQPITDWLRRRKL